MCHSIVFNFGIEERDYVLVLSLSCDKVPTSKCVVPKNRFPIATIACIARVIVGLHTKMTVS